MPQPIIRNIDDIIASASFRRWILDNNEEDAVLWQQWLAENPDKIEWVATANLVVRTLISAQEEVPATEVEWEVEKLMARIAEEEAEEEENNGAPSLTITLPEPPSAEGFKARPLVRKYWWAAACVLLLAGWLAVQGYYNKSAPQELSLASFRAATTGGNVEYVNNTDTTLHVVLKDGSKVELMKGGRLVSNMQDTGGERAVFLEGDAFFNVTKDQDHPFVVYTGKLVTRVLGTSFWVNAGANTEELGVKVKSGKVSVFKAEVFVAAKKIGRMPGGILLMPNQQVKLNARTMTLEKNVVEVPVGLKNSVITRFEATPAAEVFQHLEQAYGIPILFEESVMSDCSVTAVLEDEPFYEKLEVICRIIHARYEVVDGNVVVSSKGCK